MQLATVVVVEPNPRIAAVMARVVRPLAAKCDFADSAATALATIERQSPDVIFMSLDLPDRDGLSALWEIHKRWPEIRIVVAAARIASETVIEALRNGACDFLFEPLSERVIAAAMERITQRTLGVQTNRVAESSAISGQSPDPTAVPLDGTLKEMEQRLVREVVYRFDGNKTAAARHLGIHRKTLYRILERESS